MEVYLPLIKDKRVAVFANQASIVGSTHLVDTLLKRGIIVKKIFSPEHGFRGTADAGEQVSGSVDKQTGVQVISLYGNREKPSPEDLKDIDAIVFDIQDVGVRFYTYISSLQRMMEAAFENHKPMMILDRPNPNGFYVDGPVLDLKFKSFVGMQPVPVVYGMTIGEYALLIAGEKWLSDSANKAYAYYLHAHSSPDTPFHFLVVRCKNYTHKSRYALPVRPSPNLPNMQAVYLYPSLCFFEGTNISLGRGTDKPFQQFGSPLFPNHLYSFTPGSVEGAKNPPLKGQLCYGFDLSKIDVQKETDDRLQLKWLIEGYKLFPDKENFFLPGNFINKLAGTDRLAQQVKEGKPEAAIRKSWEPALTRFKKTRKKYLLYKDF
ncbi:MAG: DUF1343 domain-containing protein [Bacteroidetes bacterium]|nr:DUF1343 domain-containing protein [Bacteroidota bacterium]MBS1973137.1 DUF1343 domain-containing protein [Bacteroidota bacterium]